MVQKLDSACLVDIHIGNHHKQILCYVARLNMYTVVLRDKWLQIYNQSIDWKNCTMKFNSALCIESKCLAHGISCIEFAISSKAKNKIRTDKLKAINLRDIDIKPVNAKHFFQMAQKKTTKSIFGFYVY